MTAAPDGTFAKVDGRSQLRFERYYPHAVSRVWRAITDPGELVHWWPAAVEMEFRPGGEMRFTFPDNVPDVGPDGTPNEVPVSSGDPNLRGRILEIIPERVFAIDWNGETIRMELTPEGSGTRLVFTHQFDQPGAARFAAGWHVCLEALDARINNRPAPEPYAGMDETYAAYAKAFGEGV